MMKRTIWSKLLMVVIVGWVVINLLTSGCAGTRTLVLIDQYRPQFTKDWSIYKGKSLYLMNFDNRANDTSIWYYFSRDLKYSYGNNYTIHNYFWYAFSDAFVRAGMRVSSVDNPDLSAPSMWVTLRSITDERYQVRVTVQNRGASSLIKDYTIQEELPPEPKLTREELAQRAYKMTDQLIETILGDPEFQKAITESSSG